MDFLKGAASANAVRAVANAEDLDFYGCEALFNEAEFARNGRGYIQHAARNEWASVVQANCGRASIFEVGDTDFAGEGECLVRTGQVPWLDFFPERGGSAFKTEK